MLERKRPLPGGGDRKLAGVAPVIVAIALAAAVVRGDERPTNDVLHGDRLRRSIFPEHAGRVSHEPSYVIGAGSECHSPIEYAEQVRQHLGPPLSLPLYLLSSAYR
jgi:hypothetical protein